MLEAVGRRARAGLTLTAACVALVVGWGVLSADAQTNTGVTFYLSPAGDDRADGRSPTSAWQTLDRASAAVLGPGDQLLLQGGARFPGGLVLDSSDAGSASAPVIVGSFGSGRATIAATDTQGIFVYNTAGVDIRELVLTGGTVSYRSKGGITFYGDRPGQALDGVTVSGVDVSGFRHGVELNSTSAPGGFRNVSVSGSSLHDNMENGLITYGPGFQAGAPAYAHEHITVDRVQAFRNVGDATNTVRNTGSGIVLGSVRDGLVRESRAYANGSACTAPEGPVGIWTYDSTGVVIERNISHDNRTGGTADGGGFDLDQNVSDSVVQHNLSYGNDGPGFMLYTAQANSAHRGNVVRFNVSQGDVRKRAWYGGITVVGRIRDAQIHHNTVVSSVYGSVRPAPLKVDGTLSGVTVRSNVFVSNGTGLLVDASKPLATSAAVLQGNAYQAVGTWGVRWGDAHTSLDAWRRATGQELVGGFATGAAGDAGLVDPFTMVAVTDPTRLATAGGFRLQSASALIGHGLDLRLVFGTSIGTRDYYGTPLAAASTIFDVGAHQSPK